MDFNKYRLPYREDTAFSLLAVCVFLVPLAFSAFSYENFESVKFAVFLLCTGASLAVFLFSRKTGRPAIKKFGYFYGLMAAFGIWAVLSALLAQDRLYAIFGFYYRYTSGLVFFGAFLVFIVLLLNLADEQRLKFLLKITVFDALLVSLVAYFEGFGWLVYQGLDSPGFFHGPSLLGNTDYSAMFLACTLPFALYFLITSPGFKTKIYYGLCAFWIILADLILASRGALLAMVVFVVFSLLLFVVYKFPKKFFWSLLITVGIFGLLSNFFLNISRPEALSSLVSTVDLNTTSRLYAWEISFKGIAEHPWFGSGPGNYELFFEQNHSADLAGGIGIFDDAHNLFLQFAVTGGLPLALLFFCLLLLAAYEGLKEISKTKNLLTVSLLGSLAAWLAATNFNPTPVPMYVLLAVVLAGLFIISSPAAKINLLPRFKVLLIILALLICGWGAANLASEHLFALAIRARSGQKYSLAENLDNWAFVLNPTNGLFLTDKILNEIYLNKPEAEINADIKRVVNLHPGQAESYVNASNLNYYVYSQRKDKKYLQAAIDSMQKAVDHDPSFAERYGQLALYYYQLGDFSSSHNAVDRDLALNDQDFSAWILLARLYQIDKNKAGVIFALDKAFHLNPNITQLKYLLYWAKIWPDVSRLPLDLNAAQPSIP